MQPEERARLERRMQQGEGASRTYVPVSFQEGEDDVILYADGLHIPCNTAKCWRLYNELHRILFRRHAGEPPGVKNEPTT